MLSVCNPTASHQTEIQILVLLLASKETLTLSVGAILSISSISGKLWFGQLKQSVRSLRAVALRIFLETLHRLLRVSATEL